MTSFYGGNTYVAGGGYVTGGGGGGGFSVRGGRGAGAFSTDARRVVSAEEADGGCCLPGCGGADQLCTTEGQVQGEEVSFQFAGAGVGQYEKVSEYKYVGPGGSYDRELVEIRSRRFNYWCLIVPCLLVAIAVVIIIMLSQPGTTVTTTPLWQSGFSVSPYVPVTTTVPFDCDAGYWNWEKGWSNAKKHFCCDYSARGCPVVTTSLPYDCAAGFSNWQNGWSRDKKEWCCTHYSKGCQVVAVQTSQPYDCQAGLSNSGFGWSPGKKLWCCSTYTLGCPTTLPYDCDAGYQDWQSGWSDMKKHWCCAHTSRGCHITTSLPYDCDAGYANWKAGWSIQKQHYCCQYVNRGCVISQPYDCDAGYSNWHQGWAEGKKVWCCQHHNKGCLAAVLPSGSCQLWGDPHVKSFDHTQYVFYREGDFWIVKSPEFQMQGRFQATEWTRENDKTDYASMTKVIMSGSLIGHHKIEIAPMENAGQITCNGQAILPGFGEDTCGSAHLQYGAEGSLIDSAMSALPHKIVHVTFPSGIIIQVNRWPNFLNVMITMRAIPGQDGVCGNFNGHKSDDSGKLVHERFGMGVPAGELLFRDPLPLGMPDTDLPAKKCPAGQRQQARETCQDQIHASWALAECMSDVCAGDHPISHAQIYDCDAGAANWKAGWSHGKKKFCCVATSSKYGCDGM